MKGMTVRVRMHPMYVDFIKNEFGANEKGQVFASEKHPVGKLIKNLLRTNPAVPVKQEYDGNDYVEFILPEYGNVNTDYRNYLSKNSENIISTKIKSRFYFKLHYFIIEINKSGLIEIRRIIILFCERFGIKEDSYKLNSLEKEYRRYKNRTHFVKKTKEIASVFSAFLSFLCPLFVPYF